MEFSRQESWSELPFPPPGDIPDPEIESVSPVLQEDSFWLSHRERPSIILPFLFFMNGSIYILIIIIVMITTIIIIKSANFVSFLDKLLTLKAHIENTQ